MGQKSLRHVNFVRKSSKVFLICGNTREQCTRYSELKSSSCPPCISIGYWQNVNLIRSRQASLPSLPKVDNAYKPAETHQSSAHGRWTSRVPTVFQGVQKLVQYEGASTNCAWNPAKVPPLRNFNVELSLLNVAKWNVPTVKRFSIQPVWPDM